MLKLNIYLLFFTNFLFLSSLAQVEEKKEKVRRFKLAIEYSRQWNFRTINTIYNYSFNNNTGITAPRKPDHYALHYNGYWKENYYAPKYDKGSYGNSYGIYGISSIGKAFFLKYGLSANRIVYGTGIVDTVYTEEMNKSVTLPTIKNINAFSYEYTYDIVSLPIFLQYNLRYNKKLFYSFSLGLSPSFIYFMETKTTNYLTNEISYQGIDSKEYYSGSKEYYNDYLYQNILKGTYVNLRIGLNYKISKTSFLYLEPHYKINISDFKPGDRNYTLRLYSIGLCIGIAL